ncbi:calcium-binding and coiled-coil domain-containing protein 2 isoform X2 [Cheilinus undulatus]|uniref:calcium-binding and coiled-coil domain-containing protein 2 isoform X2 n=1 Tax=Cheilinus undulatus TaxID=241271 RepID=UPI001BD2427E|nr:calcium-binding and coiled-coil domain-containing protein 2 isoform X2 [Cheilinus undulatus]
MESPKEAADSSACTYSQVVFTGIPHTYPPATSVTCSFNASFHPNSRDWVGIFKVGWSTTKDYHTFVWVETTQDDETSVTRQAVFKDYYLPKDENEFYQFCYVDNTGQVRGASTPFCFRNAVDASLEVIPDDDLLVITTQEQVDQSVREKAELQKEVTQVMAENETLRNTLQHKQQEAANWKEQHDEKEKETRRLVKELDQIKEQNKNLNSIVQQQQKDTDNLKEEMSKMMKQIQQRDEAEQSKQSESLSLQGEWQQKEKQSQEKYDRAVMKINQLKAEREELKGKVNAQSAEVSTLNFTVKDQERELSKLKDSIQLLKVDLQSSEKEKERLSVELQRLQAAVHNMDDMKRENQELTRRLSQQDSAPQSCPDDDLRVEIQTLTGKLQDAQMKLAAEKEESKNARRRAEVLDRDLQDVKEQLTKVARLCEETQQTTNKQELKLNEAHELIAEKVGAVEELEDMIKLERHEKEELARENQILNRDMEGLRRLNAELQAAPPPPEDQSQNSFHIPPNFTASPTPEWQQLATPEQEEQAYETIASITEPEEESLVCCHCRESFPGITLQELEQHEQSHRVCPICLIICDNMEQSVYEDHVYSHDL